MPVERLAVDDSPATILIVEDDDALRALLAEELHEAGFSVRCAADAHAAWQDIRLDTPALVLSDLRLPGYDGAWLLTQVRTLETPPGFIIMTAFGTVPQAVEALKQGADDFLTKPLDMDHLLLCVQRTLKYCRLQRTVKQYQAQLANAERGSDFHGMIGRSKAVQSLYDTLKPIAKAAGAVLIMGESGTGKDLVARAIHQESNRSQQPFIAVNCAAIPAELQESEFFGHAAGAFTGAGKARKGLFAEAKGGTLFLDEIGEMPLELQAKLLRILQDGKVRPVGTNHEVAMDVRIVAATNLDLKEQVSLGRFREDLYYRLETFSLSVPALRERGDDVDLLVAHFVNGLGQALGRTLKGVSSETSSLLHAYPFPGNVRELRNAIERAIAFSEGDYIQANALPERIRAKSAINAGHDALLAKLVNKDTLPSLDELSNRYASFVLERVDGNKRQAAKILDISRATLYRRLGMTTDE